MIVTSFGSPFSLRCNSVLGAHDDAIVDLAHAGRRPGDALSFLAFDPGAHRSFKDHFAAVGLDVEANGSEVILKGTVRSWIEREEAERVAWSAPGVSKVDDRIVVSP